MRKRTGHVGAGNECIAVATGAAASPLRWRSLEQTTAMHRRHLPGVSKSRGGYWTLCPAACIRCAGSGVPGWGRTSGALEQRPGNRLKN